MSGFAALNGDADGAPTLPPVALTDEVTGLAAAFATMVAIHSGVGQVVDANLIESMIQIMGPLPSLWLKSGQQQPRLGSGLPYSIPRGTYRTSDDRWIAISTSADSVADRVMQLVGLGGDPRVRTVADRMDHRRLVEDRVAAWVAERTMSEALEAIEAADGAAAQVYDISDLAADPHILEREAFVTVDGYPMPNVIARLSETPGSVRWAGRSVGSDTDSVWREFGLEPPPGSASVLGR